MDNQSKYNSVFTNPLFCVVANEMMNAKVGDTLTIEIKGKRIEHVVTTTDINVGYQFFGILMDNIIRSLIEPEQD